MNRRNFLLGLLSAPLVVSAPAWALTHNKKVVMEVLPPEPDGTPYTMVYQLLRGEEVVREVNFSGALTSHLYGSAIQFVGVPTKVFLFDSDSPRNLYLTHMRYEAMVDLRELGLPPTKVEHKQPFFVCMFPGDTVTIVPPLLTLTRCVDELF
jgi:hypothetical protein